MFNIYVSKLEVKADNVSRYYHLFNTEIDDTFSAKKALLELASKFQSPEYHITVTRWNNVGTELDLNKWLED